MSKHSVKLKCLQLIKKSSSIFALFHLFGSATFSVAFLPSPWWKQLCQSHVFISLSSQILTFFFMIIHLKRRQVLSSILSIISSIASWSSSLTESFNMLSSIMLVPSSFFTVVSNRCKTDEPQTCSRRCGLARQTNRCQRILIGQQGIQAGGDCFGKSFNNVIFGIAAMLVPEAPPI